ncbi:NAD/NADP octopine/nopaline dehydrogenase family protein [Mailhella sp.]|uniref:NAD/NADP octopine/nopaline dehydrogenase family protein n=1 Tax=Mailhella sp. TaxID=1981029 RepID=UPI003AB37EDC
MKTDVVIIGCGSTGKTTAAWFTLRGVSVTLCDTERFSPDMDDIRHRGGILLRGRAGVTGKALPARMTTDFQEALAASNRILVCVPDYRHEEIARLCAPYFRSDHCALIVPGNLGSLVFRRALKEAGCDASPCLAEMSDNLWACRTTGDNEVLAALPLPKKRVAALPASATFRVVEAFENILPLTPGTNIVETTLNSPNVLTHLAGTVPNASAVEKSGGQFAFFRDGLSPAVIRCIAAVETERNAVLASLGLERYGGSAALCESLLRGDVPDGFDLFLTLDGPGDLKHRYVTEDAACGMALLVSLAELCGLKTPVSRALLTLASCFNGEDYLKNGRTLSNMGLGELSVSELMAALA